METQNTLHYRKRDPSYVRCFLVGALLAFLCFALALGHLWRGISAPDSELFNYHEWSLVQGLEREWRDSPAMIVTIPNARNSPDYDAIVLPRLDGQGSVVILSNADGIPRIKALFSGPLRHICPADYDDIKATVRLNAEVEVLLQALTKPDCGT